MLQLFLEHAQEFLTSQWLSETLSISEKTVRNLIGDINVTYARAVVIQGKQGKGYQMQVNNAVALSLLLQEESSASEDERENYLLTRLFFEGQTVSVEELLGTLFISESTLSKLVTGIRRRLKPYHLQLKKSRQSFQVIGEEKDKRRFIIDYFVSHRLHNSLFGYTEIAQLFEGVDVKELYRSILEVCREEGIQLSDFALTNLLVHLSLAIKRLEAGHCIEAVQIDDSAFYQQTKLVSQRMIERIALYTGIQLPMEEASYITLHLLGKGRGQLDVGQSPVLSDACLQDALHQLAEKLAVSLDVTDEVLLHGLREHFGPLLLRLDNAISLDNPLYEQLREEYAPLLEGTQSVFETLPVFKGRNVSHQEWAYIALHILAAIERQGQQRRLRVVLVCATGFGSAQVLKNRIEHHFSHRLEIVACLSVHELGQQDFSGVDFIISALDLSRHLYPRPIVEVSVLVNEEDIRRLEQFIGGAYRAGQNRTVDADEELCAAVAACCSPERFFLLHQPSNKEVILSQLVASLSEGGNAAFHAQMIAQIQEREELGSVVFSSCIAVPHPARSIATQEEVAIAISHFPIYWDAAHPEVQIAILISPSKWSNPHLSTFSKVLAAFVQDEKAQAALLEAPSLSLFQKIMCLIP